MLSCSKGMFFRSTCLFLFLALLKNFFNFHVVHFFYAFWFSFFDNVVQVFFPQFLGWSHLTMLLWNLHQSGSCFLRLLHPFCLLFTNSNYFFYLLMFSFYRNGIRNSEKEDFAVLAINDIYARKILIYARKKDVNAIQWYQRWQTCFLNGNLHKLLE